MFETLSSYGITPSVLQILIVTGFAVFLIGMFWQYILIGAGVLFCVYIFLMPTDASTKEVKKPETVKSVVVEEKDDTPIEYIQDCMRLTSKNEFDCKVMWHDRENNG
jgi:hypothetical protein